MVKCQVLGLIHSTTKKQKQNKKLSLYFHWLLKKPCKNSYYHSATCTSMICKGFWKALSSYSIVSFTVSSVGRNLKVVGPGREHKGGKQCVLNTRVKTWVAWQVPSCSTIQLSAALGDLKVLDFIFDQKLEKQTGEEGNLSNFRTQSITQNSAHQTLPVWHAKL